MFLIEKEKFIYAPYDALPNRATCEMSRDDSGFLAYFLVEKKPKKILEVGLAAGSTTRVILDIIKSYNLQSELYPVDLNKYYYRDITNKVENPRLTCFECEGINYPKHHLLTGQYLPEVIEEIGSGIDFLLLDTVHALPGELLDWLVAFPFLTSDACLILHDVHFHFYPTNKPWVKKSYATHCVLDSITAKKFLFANAEAPIGMPNIGAALLDENTAKYIESSFISLSLPWAYLPHRKEVGIYHNFYLKYYPPYCADYFLKSYTANARYIKG